MALSKVGKNQVDQSASLTVDSDLTVDTNTLYVDSTNNRVGIGNVTPAEPLHISTTGATQIKVERTIGGNTGIHFTDTTYNTHIGLPTGGGFAIDDDANLASSPWLNIDTSGRVTMPSQPSFRAGGAPSPSTGTNYVNYGTVNHNIGNHFNATNGRFTAPVAGRYLFVLTVGSNSSFGVDLMLNGGSTISRIEVNNPPGFTWQTGALVMQLNPNDFVVAYVFTGTAAMTSGQGNFSGHLLG